MSNEITNKNEELTEIEKEEKLQELKEYATDLGISFRDNIGITKLQYKINEVEEQIASEAKVRKTKVNNNKEDRVTIVVEPRYRDERTNNQFFGYNSLKLGIKENIQIQFGEEVHVTRRMYEYIKSITFSEKKFKMVTDQDGIPKKEWYDKKQTRFIVSKV